MSISSLKYPATLQSNNPNAYSIVIAEEIGGHRTVATLSDLFAIPDAILSASTTNAANDAIGQLWYVVEKGEFYQLKNWANRTNLSGWSVFQAGSGASSGEGCATKEDLENLQDELDDKADKSYVDETVASLVGSAPETLNTLKELADALGENQDVVDALNQSITNKADKDDVQTLQNMISASNPPVVTPTIDVTWTAFNQDEVEVDSLPYEDGSKSSPVLEVGYKLRYNATYKWTAESGKQNPTSVDTGNSNWGATLPASGVNSAEITNETLVTSTTTLKITLQAPEVGLKVNDQKYLVPASGSVKSSASVGASFRKRLYYGKTTATNITQDIIKKLSFKSLVTSNTQEISNVTLSETEYFVYASTSELRSILQDKSTTVMTAFLKTEVKVTNAAGYEQTYYVYRTANPKAFTNATLNFNV